MMQVYGSYRRRYPLDLGLGIEIGTLKNQLPVHQWAAEIPDNIWLEAGDFLNTKYMRVVGEIPFTLGNTIYLEKK
jgi:hypothetical protein